MYMPKILKSKKNRRQGVKGFMELIIYGTIFIIGTLFGSFFTLAVYRIPQGLNILYEHSFCPNCGTKLRFKDLIPILSYISLKGKCRYCGQKVRIRYLLLEVLSGLVFLLVALSLKLDIYNIGASEIINFSFFMLYIACLFIIAGIDKERITIQKSVLLFGLILGICFMIYVCISSRQVIYTYIIYLAVAAFILILDTAFLKKKLCENYTISLLILGLYMIIFTGSEVFYYTISLSLLLIGIMGIVDKIRKSAKSKSVIEAKNNKELEIPVGFYLTISNILLLIISNFLK